ncbi:MAG: macB 9 [Symbiobacteriaceae bacterium]|jgi:putative ABC transport system ATP-binding protein|nr:macB 9 [Symbiobacteriaceae bacterium]
MPPVITLRGITKTYQTGEETLHALAGVDLTVEPGEFVAIVGPSGSGKSTLLSILGCLDNPTSGEYRLDGANVAGLSEDQLSRIRNQKIGFVFQAFHLLPRLTVAENVETPLLYAGLPAKERKQRVAQALARVGLTQKADREPNQLSGGQRQRVAIARALVTRPSLMLADEPTGNLDSRTGREVLALLQELHKAGSTIVLVTHDPAIAATAERTIEVRDGLIVRQEVALL